jgi:tRNA(Ile)-lysidine synthase
MTAPAPLSSADCDRLFEPLADFSHILLAVSGGVDSTVLLHLICAWAQDRAASRKAKGLAPLRISVACVDHGLRAGSAQEAQAVKDLAAQLGCEGAVLYWSGEKPATRLQETARDKRYDLLSAHARDIGAEALVLAHHADDQAETLLMRMAAGSGPEGLCGMRGRMERDGLILLRPFLAVPKAVLVATAHARHWHWHEDPSNRQERFERVRLRQWQDLRDALGLNSQRLGRLALRMQRQHEAIEQMVADNWTRLGHCEAERIVLKGEIWSLPQEIRLRLLAKAVQTLCPETRVRLERLETVEARLNEGVKAGQTARRTIGGCILTLSDTGRLTLTPEPPRRENKGLPREKAARV